MTEQEAKDKVVEAAKAHCYAWIPAAHLQATSTLHELYTAVRNLVQIQKPPSLLEAAEALCNWQRGYFHVEYPSRLITNLRAAIEAERKRQ